MKTSKHPVKQLSAIFLTILGISFYSIQTCYALPDLSPEKGYSEQCVDIIKALERYHFLGKHLDEPMSAEIFDRYIKQLDPTRQLFTQKDLSDFYFLKHQLHRTLKRGDLKAVYDIFNLYQARSVQRMEYILELVKTWESELEFDQDDSLMIDNDSRAVPETPDELFTVWKKEFKNYVITQKLDGKTDPQISETLEKIYTNRLSRLSQTNSNDVFQLFMNAVTASFDPHTQYFAPRVSEDFDIHMSLSLEGIGAVLQNEYEYTKVVRLIPKGPADKSHQLMPGDKIIGVGQGKDGEIVDTIGQRIDDVVKLIRGPKDTYVRLKIIPAKKVNTTATIRIRRDKVKLEEQSAQKKTVTLNRGGKAYKIGIIEIPSFYIDFNAYHRGDRDYKSTTKDVEKLLVQLKKEKIDGLIIDLRDNGGGSLTEANNLTGLFLKSGPTVQIKTKRRITRLYDEDPDIQYTGPLVVLINRMSASASEIFAGAIKDYNRGVIVGTTSFGKGTVQELKPLGDGKLKLTSAKFYRVSGESTQHKGVVPDLKYPQIYKVKQTGESSLEGALLWDRIKSTRYEAYSSLDTVFRSLGRKYIKRTQNAPGMIYLKERIEMTNQLSNRRSVSLNLEKRRSKNQAFTQKELDMENQFRRAKGKEAIDSLEDGSTRLTEYKEILMEQTHEVAVDFINLASRLGYSW